METRTVHGKDHNDAMRKFLNELEQRPMSADGGARDHSREYWKHRERALECPHCGAYVAVDWKRTGPLGTMSEAGSMIERANCLACEGILIALNRVLIYPDGLVGPAASSDMPDLVRTEYDEARKVGAASPRAAAALLRLAIQKLIDQLKPGDEKLSEKIGLMVAQGEIRQVVADMLDVVRVTGNHAVHPGQIDLNAEPERVDMLFRLTNALVEQTITVDRLAQDAKAALPRDEISRIERRQKRIESGLNRSIQATGA